MKILHVTNYFKPSWESGGVTRVVYELATEMVRKGHDVTVITSDGFKKRLDVENGKETLVDEVKVFYFRNLSQSLAKMNITLPLFNKKKIKEIIRKSDFVHIHEHRSYFAYLAYNYCKKYNIPYIIHPHGSARYDIGKSWMKKSFDSVVGNSIMENCKAVIALNETEKGSISEIFNNEDKIRIIPNGVKLKELAIPEVKENQLIYVGRFHESKGIDLILDSMQILNEKGIDFKMKFIGPDDGYQDQMEKYIQNNDLQEKVSILGYVSIEEKEKELMRSKLFFTPKFSGFPISFLEAAHMGIPIVTTNVGDKLDFFENNIGLVTDYDANEYSKAIMDLLNNKSIYSDMSRNSISIIKDIYNWERISETFLDLYAVILK